MAARFQAILLPGVVLPAEIAYAALIGALGEEADTVAKELEVYAGDEPPADYSLGHEIDGILRTADGAGFERFHLVGYSAGGASSLMFAAAHGARLLSLALLEPAWAGNEGLDPAEEALSREFDRLVDLPPDEMMAAFVRMQLAPDASPPPPPEGDPPPWMAKRPAGIRAFNGATASAELDLGALSRFGRPVYYALGGLSNPDYYGKMAARLERVFPDFTLEVFEDRHHFDPPHRIEPERLAASLRALWGRAP